MTMLKSFDLKGNKQSFANWISNLSPTETPFISMIPKQKVDQIQYSWQTDRLSQPGKQAAANGQEADAVAADSALAENKEGSAAVINNMMVTKVHTNFTQIFRKAVRVTDTTKKIALYGRNSELAYQMEKAGLEIKRDLEYSLLNNTQAGRPGTAALHGICEGVMGLIATQGKADPDTGAIVHQAVNHAAGEAPFTKADVFKLTLNLYLAGARCNKLMFHPMHMAVFSDWVSDANPKGTSPHVPKNPHLHRMFDGMDDKYNAFVQKFRDPLGQEFTLIPNRHMPKNKLFFFNESDWTQMVLREPEKVLLAKMGSSEKHMIEMEVGLRHRNPFASGILLFTLNNAFSLKDPRMTPQNVELMVNSAGVLQDVESEVSVVVQGHDGSVGSATEAVEFIATIYDEDGTAPSMAAVTGSATTNGVAKAKVKHNKSARVKVTAKIAAADKRDDSADAVSTSFGTFETRDGEPKVKP